jgi:glycosyltransferase involved in cell wall biosynthesis/SAM-dependent methyltransferase
VALKVAFFSPLPPAKSGIADYSAALVAELRRLVSIETFTAAPANYNPADFDVALYQIGNNPHHDFCYEMALRYPGVPVIHEANLHHLIADITIKRGDWDAYLREVEFDGGAEALAYAQRVKTLEVGPDYDGVPMLRRLLCASRAAIVHSECVEQELRKAGFTRPVGRIQHGAWAPEADRMGYRQRLGIGENTLIGAFGFLKPYKRIAESLRAFRRLLKVEPGARMILVGEPHPEFPLDSLIESLGLGPSVRVIGFAPIDDFVGYLAACDIVLNLRFPTVGENSGTLMRALGLGKAVIVSDVGSFREFPDDIVLKVPVDASEEDLLFEYLNLLVSRPRIRASLGQAALQWVERECTWRRVAERYAEFLDAVHTNRSLTVAAPAKPTEPPPCKSDVEPGYVESWAPDEPVRQYIQTHLARFVKTLAITPPGDASQRILEMGSYLQITPALRTKLGYGEVRGCYYGPAGKIDHKRVVSSEGEEFECEIDLFNAEKDRFPYADEWFDTVLCCELLEHLTEDPMFMMVEINRILKPGGHLVLTTPNIGSLRAISAILQGYHPGFFPAYIRPPEPENEPEARHNREYTPREIKLLLLDAGLEPTLLETGEFREEPHPEHFWVADLLDRYRLSPDMRGDGIYAVGRKTGVVRDRYPAWLYNG